jgi:hypothetical protein
MINRISNFFKTVSAFLQNDEIPPVPSNSSNEELENLANTNHLKSKKFFIVFTSSLMLAFFYFSSVFILFLLPEMPEIIAGYVTIFSRTIEVFSLIVGVYLGIQAAIDFKISSGTNTNYSSNVENITEKIYTEEYLSGPKEKDYEVDISIIPKKNTRRSKNSNKN